MRKSPSVVSRAGLAFLAGLCLCLAGCAATGGSSGMGYYWQSLRGQVQLLQASRPIADWLQDEQLPASLRQRLQEVQRMRAFASSALGLPDNASYHRYADLGRPFAVWNVVAAPHDSLELRSWCFPIAGCVGYRGYFDEADARRQAGLLAGQGLESSVYGVPAYSTLGYLNWLGGDPLLNTFIDWNEAELAGLLFHELAHQVVYLAGDTAFNESFATAVERLGTGQWLAAEASAQARARWEAGQTRRAQWRALTSHTRQALQQLYQSRSREPAGAAPLEPAKAAIYGKFRSDYAALRDQWQAQDAPLLATEAQRQRHAAQQARMDQWVAQANNASFGAMAAYDDWVGAFTALWHEVQRSADGSDTQAWPRFYAAVREWAVLPAPQRTARLCAYMPADAPLPPGCAAGQEPTAQGALQMGSR